MSESRFLTARWENLIMANYQVDPQILLPYLPKGADLDYYEGKCYVSLVGFMFLKTKLLGISVPFHQNFEEFNLRFYVKFGCKRGAVFIKEIVPKPAIAYIAKWTYREPYCYMPMKHKISQKEYLEIEYAFCFEKKWNTIKVIAENTTSSIIDNSKESFILEHYWGYNKYSEDKTMEYGVEHEKWHTHAIKSYMIQINFEKLYGKEISRFLTNAPDSIFLATGSDVIVRKGKMINYAA